MKTLLLQNWLAKLLSLAVAVVLWVAIKKSLEMSDSTSKGVFRPEERFQFETTRNGEKK